MTDKQISYNKRQSGKNITKRLTRLSLFCALALIMSFIEAQLPPLISAVPGAKMGLSNVVTLTAIVMLGSLDAVSVQLVRCVLGGLITGGMSALMYSVPAGAVSVTAMILLYNLAFPKVSLIGISFVAAVFHNITQVSLACIYLESPNLMLTLPYYILAGVAAGLFVGIVSFYAVKYLPKRVYLN